jgi:peroxiredoxin
VKAFKEEFDRRGVGIIVISFAEPERLAPYQEDHRWPFAMLADPQRIAYQAFALKRLSLLHVFSLSTLRLYIKLFGEGKKIQSYGRDDYYQAGGDFLIDHRGNVFFAHRSQNPADRPPIEKLLNAVDRILSGASLTDNSDSS